MVVRNESGEVVAGVARKVLVSSSIEAEAAALRGGVWLADAMNMKKVILETDTEILHKEITGIKKMGYRKVQSYIVYTEQERLFYRIQMYKDKKKISK